MSSINDTLQWVGCASGMVGSLLLATNSRWSGWGFVVYLASNACWAAFGLATHAPGLVAQQVVFTVTSVLGVWRWLVTPRLAAAARGLHGRPSSIVFESSRV